MTCPVIKFNVGGFRYEVSQSLLDAYPNTRLAKSASKQWSGDPNAEIFIERDGDRFRLVLDYLRDGRVFLPVGSSKDALLMELQYYGVDNVRSDYIVDTREKTFLYGQSTLLAPDLAKSWGRKIAKHQSAVQELINTLKLIGCNQDESKCKE